MNALPEEESHVTLPAFPAKKAFERAEISKTASVRQHAFDSYCMALLECNIVSRSKILSNFCLPKRDDINPLLSSTTATTTPEEDSM